MSGSVISEGFGSCLGEGLDLLDWGHIRAFPMDSIDVFLGREQLCSSVWVTCLTWPPSKPDQFSESVEGQISSFSGDWPPCRLTRWSSNWLWCELPVLYRLIPLDDAGIVILEGLCSTREVGTEEDGKIIPEVVRIEWGWGWCSLNPCIPVMIDTAGF